MLVSISKTRSRFGAAVALAGVAAIASTLLGASFAVADSGGPPTAPSVAPAAGLALRGPATAIVILGHGLLPDGGMRDELYARLRAGFAQALLAPASPVVVTGGNPRNGRTEAHAMANWLIGHGLPAHRVVVEDRATSTAENAFYSARMLREVGAADAVLVTSADHLARATRLFQHAGVAVIAGVTPDQVPNLPAAFGPRP